MIINFCDMGEHLREDISFREIKYFKGIPSPFSVYYTPFQDTEIKFWIFK